MKNKLVFVVLCIFYACTNTADNNARGDSIGTSTNAVDNVNGNVADTTSGIQLNQPLPVDSSRIHDSIRR